MGGTHWASRVIFWHFVVQLWGEPLVYHINMWILIISPDWHQATQNQTKPLGQQNLQSPQLPRPSGHHSQASWVAKHWPVEKGRQGNSKSKTFDHLQNLSIRPWILQNEIWGVTPALNQPPCQTQKSFNILQEKNWKGFDSGSISSYSGVILLTLLPRFTFQD